MLIRTRLRSSCPKPLGREPGRRHIWRRVHVVGSRLANSSGCCSSTLFNSFQLFLLWFSCSSCTSEAFHLVKVTRELKAPHQGQGCFGIRRFARTWVPGSCRSSSTVTWRCSEVVWLRHGMRETHTRAAIAAESQHDLCGFYGGLKQRQSQGW